MTDQLRQGFAGYSQSATSVSPVRFHRTIEVTVSRGETLVELEDDYHRFGLVVRHESGKVAAIDAEAGRHPWSTCAMAPAMIAKLVGTPISGNLLDLMAGQPVRDHCTHLLDMACLAIAATAWGGDRRYDITADVYPGSRQDMQLAVGGIPCIAWTVSQGMIVSLGAHRGLSVRGGFADWARVERCEKKLADLFILRRAVMVSSGRREKLTAETPADVPSKAGACFAFQSERAALGRRVPGWVESIDDYARRRSSVQV